MASDKLKNALYAASIKILISLVRIFLRNGVSYGVFAELAKRAFIKVSEDEFKLPGKKQTTTYISTITGMTRKEVLRIRKLPEINDFESMQRYNRATRVTSAWAGNSDFLDKRGLPVALPFYGDIKSFTSLCKKSSGDIPARTILDELERAGTVSKLKDGRIKLNSRAYVPKGDELAKISILGNDVSDLINTIDHNTTCEPGDNYFQRKVSYDNIPDALFVELKDILEKKAQNALEEIDTEISKRDRDSTPNLTGTGRNRIGISIFYFDEAHSGKEQTENGEDK